MAMPKRCLQLSPSSQPVAASQQHLKYGTNAFAKEMGAMHAQDGQYVDEALF
jgi:hypothetical protein